MGLENWSWLTSGEYSHCGHLFFFKKKKKIQLKIFLDIPWFLVHMVSWGTLALWSLQVLGWGLAVICKLG